jgi:hypothetical protein
MRIRPQRGRSLAAHEFKSNLLLTVDTFRLLTAHSNAKPLVPSCR